MPRISKNARPTTTLFLLVSADGKISTGDIDRRDFDTDLLQIPSLATGLRQYYELEQKTDHFSLMSGKTLAKIGANKVRWTRPALPVTFVVIDHAPHLNSRGIRYLAAKGRRVIVATSNRKHHAYRVKEENVVVMPLPRRLDPARFMNRLYVTFGIRHLTVQTGGRLNAAFIRAGVIDRLSLVIAPLLVGGAMTPTMMDGASLRRDAQLRSLRTLRLRSAKKLRGSYLHLVYAIERVNPQP